MREGSGEMEGENGEMMEEDEDIILRDVEESGGEVEQYGRKPVER